MPQLLHAHLALRRRHADGAELVGDLRARQTDQRRLRRRHVGFERDLFQRRGAPDVSMIVCITCYLNETVMPGLVPGMTVNDIC